MEHKQTEQINAGNANNLLFSNDGLHHEYTDHLKTWPFEDEEITTSANDDDEIILPHIQAGIYNVERMFVNNFTATCCGSREQNFATHFHNVSEVLYIIYSVYISLIFVLGLCQNSITLYVFVKERCLRRSHNIFIIGLALSDVCMCVFSTWMVILSSAYHRWIFGYPGK